MTKDKVRSTKEALKLALEALEVSVPVILKDFSRHGKAITAIKEALMSGTDGAQPEQVFTYEQMKEHAEGLQRDYDLLLAEYNLLKQDLITVADIEKIIKFKERNK